MVILYTVLAIIFLLIFITIITSYSIYRNVFRGIKKPCDPYYALEKERYDGTREKCKALIDKIVSEPYREISIKSFDGLTLYARYFEQDKNAPLEIQCHGYKSTPLRDMSGGGNEALARGHNLLLIHQRAHGVSEGKTITFGEKERLDLLSFINYANKELLPNAKIILSGVSMGATTVLLATELDLPKNVVGVVADCPYSSTRDIIMKCTRDRKLPAKLLYPFVKLGCLLFGHFNPDAHSAKEAVKHTKIPILLIHGESDTFVPICMSEEIYNNNKKMIRFEKFKDADHGMSYIVDTERYKNIITSTLGEILK